MAFERTSDAKIKGDSLDVFVENISKSFGNQLAVRNAEDELQFNKAVLEDGISVEDQLAYRQEQLKRVSDDPQERKRIKNEVAALKQRVVQTGFSNDYLDKLNDFQSGLASVDSVISWLKDQESSIKDPDTLALISKQIGEMNDKKFTLTKSLIENQTAYAVNDKSDSIIGAQIEKVKSAKAAALLVGDQTLASTYDLQLQSLTKARTENNISNSIMALAAQTAVGNSSATGLLDAYNGKANGASASSGPITVGGVTYQSEKDFWTYKRDSYVADNSQNGFFTRLNGEVNTNLKTLASKNSLDTSALLAQTNVYNGLSSRPELANYAATIANTRQDSLQAGANLIANRVIDTYAVNYDINTAVTTLNNLKTLGTNVDDPFNKILTKSAEIKSAQVNNVLQTADSYFKSDPTITAEAALNKAIASNAAAATSPTQLATTPVKDLAKTQLPGATPLPNAPQTTVQPPTTITPPQAAPVAPKPVVTTPPPAPTPTIALNKQLDFGMRDAQVLELQKFLNKAGFSVAPTGQAGSAGMETDYFGPATQAALQKFQAAKGIVSTGDAATTGYGRLGPQTLSAISNYTF